MTEIQRLASSDEDDVLFKYDAMGRRICKIVKPRTGGVVDNANIKTTWYSLDAQGNVMATYTQTGASPTATVLDEFALYGAGRLGTQDIGTTLATTPNFGYVTPNGKTPEAIVELKLTTFSNTQNVQYSLGSLVLNPTPYQWNTSNTIQQNAAGLMAAINANTVTTDVSASLWYSNNATGTLYMKLEYSQPGNWQLGALSCYVNGVASNAAGHLPKRALGYGTAKGSDIVGQKRYELSNHLNNVLEVISDRKWATDNGQYNLTTGAQTSSTPDGLADYYLPVIVAYTDYDPYGTAQTGRKGGDPTYRYGFQGQEMDDEIKGEGNSVNYEYRMHDPRLGRFFAVDPLAPKYPHNSPYAFSENVVINAVELEGLERKYSFNSAIAAENFNSKLKAYNAGTISYEQLTSYLNAHSISYMHESAREYVRKQLAKGKTKEAVWVNNRDSGVRYISHDGGSTAGWIIVNTIVKNEDGSYDRKAISIGNPDAPVAKGSAFPTGMAIGGHWWEDGQGPFTKVELKLTTYTLTVGGHKYESGFTLKESGLDGGTDVFTFHKTLLTTDYSKVPKVGGPSLTLDFYLSDGDKTKPNIALKASGQSRILKVGTSINTNGENKFSVGVALPKANDKVSVSLEYELKKTETKVNF